MTMLILLLTQDTGVVLIHRATESSGQVEASSTDHTTQETNTVVLETDQHTGGGDHDNEVCVALLIVVDSVVNSTSDSAQLDTTDEQHDTQDRGGEACDET